MKTLSTIFFLTWTVTIYAQKQDVINSSTTNSISINNVGGNVYQVLSGSAYIDEKFKEGAVLLNTDKWVPKTIRYNSYTSKIEFMEGGTVQEFATETVKAFKLGDMYFKNGFKPLDKQNKYAYYQIIYEGKQTILKYIYTELHEVYGADDVKNGTEFLSYSKYYVLNNDLKDSFVLRKQVLKYIDTTKLSTVEAFIKKENIKFKTDQELAKIFAYYESLP